MPTKPATTDRRLRSQASEDDIASEVEFNIRTESDSRSNSESEDGGNETILNTSNDTNMSEQRGGGERIDLTNVEQTVRVEVTGEEERKRSGRNPDDDGHDGPISRTSTSGPRANP